MINIIYYRHQQHLINSSSMHTIVLFPNNKTIRDSYGPSGYGKGEFGWQHFTAKSAELKKDYLATICRDGMEDRLGADAVDIILRDWFGEINVTEDKEGIKQYDNSYIDHQSLMVLPRQHGSKLVNKEFVMDFMKFLQERNIAILGGNDNDEECHPLAKDGTTIDIPLPTDHRWLADYLVARKDEQGFWIVFNQKSGTQVIFSFDQMMPLKNDCSCCHEEIPHFSMEMKPEKSTLPIGIDLKITDRCYRNCKFCYEGSTPAGKHFNGHRWASYLAHFKDMELFEICIGGGEPLLHPKFIKMLHDLREIDVVPSFTTRETDWLRDGRRSEIIDVVGSFAISMNEDDISSVSPIKELATTLDYHSISHELAAVQVVMGTIREYVFSLLLEQCYKYNITLSLLGYKSGLGRSPEFKSSSKFSKYPWWIKRVQKANDNNKMPKIVIDTVLAAQFADELKKLDVPSWSWDIKEGRFTCYVDIIKNTMAASSYSRRDDFLEFDVYGKNAMDVFRKEWLSLKVIG